MRRTRVRFTVRGMMVVVAVISVLVGGYVRSLRSGYCYLRVVNQSGQPIPQLTVAVRGERVEIEDLADGASATVPFWGREATRFSVAGALTDKTPVMTSVQLAGNPKRFRQIVGTVRPGGQFRLALSR